MIININTNQCEYIPTRKALQISSSKLGTGVFPYTVNVTSHHTGRVVVFHPISPDHPNFDDDQWDGEQMIYSPKTGTSNTVNVKILTIYRD